VASRPQQGRETEAERRARFEALQYMHSVFAASDATAVRRGVGVPAQAAPPSQILRMTAPEMDFALDDPVARRLLQVASGQGGNRDLIASWAASCPVVPFRGPTASIGPMPPALPSTAPGTSLGSSLLNGFDNPVMDATFGGGNILGNTFGVYQALDHTAGRAVFDIQQARAVDRIVSGSQQSARINSMVQIYDANAQARATALRNGTTLTAAQAQPRLRVKLGSLPMEIIDPHLADRLRAGVIGRSHGATNFGPTAQSLVSRGVVEAQWAQRMKFLGSKSFGGILAFAPSAVIDLAASSRGGSFDGKDFLVRSAKSQSLNLLGFGAGLAIGFLFAGAAIGAAPLVLLVVGTGVVVQLTADVLGVDSASERVMRRVVGR
jgi:hypothetical protein